MIHPSLSLSLSLSLFHTHTQGSRTISFDSTDEMMEIMAEGNKTSYREIRSSSPGGQSSDDVVHCICGDDTDEGFMIQVGL